MIKKLPNRQASSRLNWLECRLRACVLRNVTGSIPSFPLLVISTIHLLCNVWVQSLILSVGSLHRSLAHEYRHSKEMSILEKKFPSLNRTNNSTKSFSFANSIKKKTNICGDSTHWYSHPTVGFPKFIGIVI